MTQQNTRRKVLVIRLSSLGDILLTFPALSFLIEQNYEVHFLTKDKFKDAVGLAQGVATIHTLADHASLSELKLKIRELEKYSFDFIYDLHANLRSRIITSFLKVPYKRIRKHRLSEWLLFFLRRKLYRALGLGFRARAEEAEQTVGGKGKELRLLVNKGTSLPDEISQWIDQRPRFICISSESIWSQKEWPIGQFIQVARKLTEKGHGVIWMGLKPVPDAARFDGTLDLTGKLSITQVAVLLSKADLLLCNDSGLMHLSETVGTPVVALFGPTSAELGFAPRLQKSQRVEADLWCRPCSKTGKMCFRIFDRRKCLKMISVDKVLMAIEKNPEKKAMLVRADENLDL